jgi:hypothetical protein
MHTGRGALLDSTGLLSIARWDDRVDLVHTGTPDASSELLRPDGHIAWIGEQQSELDEQLERWFGPAS